MKDYSLVYERWSRFFRQTEQRRAVLVWLNRLISLTMYLVYPLVLLYRFLGGQDWFSALWVAGLGFGLVSLFRYLLNQPRPYETWDIDPLIAKDTKGQSMPSRHVFSAVMVAMVVYQSLPWLGGIFLVLALLLALVRVLGGVHYAKDVLVAYLLALAWSSLLWV